MMKAARSVALLMVMLVSALVFVLLPTQLSAEWQQAQSANNTASNPTSQQDTTIKVNVRVVPVRVVVRDSSGHAIGGLRSSDFGVYDDGKPQEIRQFSAESVEPSRESAVPDSKQSSNLPQPKSLPQRYLAYVFDDIHLNLAGLRTMQAASIRPLKSLQAGDRAAVFSSSGKVSLDFTDNRAMVEEVLQRVSPHPMGNSEARGCPAISHYMADLIVNKQDEDAAGEAMEDALNCAYGGDIRAGMATEAMVNTEAEYQLRIGDMETDAVLSTLDTVIRRLSQLPGQRSLVLISPGFFVSDTSRSRFGLLDNAVRANVTISALDSRGLYAVPARSGGMSSDAASANTQVISTLTDGTGGVYFHNKNDLDEGFRVTSDSPQYSYVLSFSPPGFKPDGRFHSIKVIMKTRDKYSIQARPGYYALRGAEQAVVQSRSAHAKSVPDRNDIPVDLETEVSSSGSKRKLTIMANVAVNRLHFRKKDGRNVDELTMVSSLFDEKGKYVKGDKKNIHLHVTDDTLKNQLNDGLPLTAEFELTAGNYQLRVSLEDADGGITNLEKVVEVR